MNSYASLTILLISCFSWTVSGFFPSNSRGGVKCDDPRIPNGDHTPKAWFVWTHPVFTTLTFECDEGYRLIGSKTAQCMLTGEWTQLPSCVASEAGSRSRIRCELPAIGDNVEVYPMKATYLVEESVSFVCPGVRKSEGISRTNCGDDGQFHPTPPKCIQPRCVPPEIPQNGGLSSDAYSFAVGDVVEFKCADGYELVGDESTTCGEDGYFPYTETSCEPIMAETPMCSRPEIGRKQAIYQDKTEYLPGQNVTFFCASGYRLRGSAVLQCLSDGEWSDRAPQCKRIICIRPRNPVNGRVLSRADRVYYLAGQSLRFSCNNGYTLSGPSSCKCGMDGYFHPKAPTCIRSANIYTFVPGRF